jgi:hypothetical protein
MRTTDHTHRKLWTVESVSYRRLPRPPRPLSDGTRRSQPSPPQHRSPTVTQLRTAVRGIDAYSSSAISSPAGGTSSRSSCPTASTGPASSNGRGQERHSSMTGRRRTPGGSRLRRSATRSHSQRAQELDPETLTLVQDRRKKVLRLDLPATPGARNLGGLRHDPRRPRCERHPGWRFLQPNTDDGLEPLAKRSHRHPRDDQRTYCPPIGVGCDA